MTGKGYRKFIKELIEDDIEYHDHAIKETRDFVSSPADRAWVHKHYVWLSRAEEAMMIWNGLNEHDEMLEKIDRCERIKGLKNG